jgi:hypothetical protein
MYPRIKNGGLPIRKQLPPVRCEIAGLQRFDHGSAGTSLPGVGRNRPPDIENHLPDISHRRVDRFFADRCPIFGNWTTPVALRTCSIGKRTTGIGVWTTPVGDWTSRFGDLTCRIDEWTCSIDDLKLKVSRFWNPTGDPARLERDSGGQVIDPTGQT